MEPHHYAMPTPAELDEVLAAKKEEHARIREVELKLSFKEALKEAYYDGRKWLLTLMNVRCGSETDLDYIMRSIRASYGDAYNVTIERAGMGKKNAVLVYFEKKT